MSLENQLLCLRSHRKSVLFSTLYISLRVTSGIRHFLIPNLLVCVNVMGYLLFAFASYLGNANNDHINFYYLGVYISCDSYPT